MSVLLPCMLLIALKISKCSSNSNLPNFFGTLPSIRLLRIDCLSFVHLQDGPRSGLLCILYKLAVEISSCPQELICTNFLLAHDISEPSDSLHRESCEALTCRAVFGYRTRR